MNIVSTLRATHTIKFRNSEYRCEVSIEKEITPAVRGRLLCYFGWGKTCLRVAGIKDAGQWMCTSRMVELELNASGIIFSS